MKLLRFALVGLAVAVSGCIDVDEQLMINRDGTARMDLSYSMAEQTIDQLKGIARLEADMAQAAGEKPAPKPAPDLLDLFLDPNAAQLREELKKYESCVRVDTLSVETQSARRYVRLSLYMKDLAALAKTDFFQKHGFSLTKNAEGDYTLYRESETLTTDPGVDLTTPEMTKALMPFLGGFKVLIKVTTPGTIKQTNASKRTTYSATWYYNYNDDPAAFAAFHNHRLLVEFRGKDVSLPDIASSRAGARGAGAPPPPARP
jgi:hypothetical protein